MTRRLPCRSAVALTLAATLLGSCAPTPQNCQLNQTATGALVGAGIGAALGGIGAAAGHARAGTGVAIAAGAALAGAAIGAMIGRHQDDVCHQLALKQALDLAIASNAAAQAQRSQPVPQAPPAAAAPVRRATPIARARPVPPPPPPEYQSVAWANKMTNDAGTITPVGEVTQTSSNEVCMTFNDQQTANGQTQVVTGKACRGPDGEWKPVS